MPGIIVLLVGTILIGVGSVNIIAYYESLIPDRSYGRTLLLFGVLLLTWSLLAEVKNYQTVSKTVLHEVKIFDGVAKTYDPDTRTWYNLNLLTKKNYKDGDIVKRLDHDGAYYGISNLITSHTKWEME